jgi:hypothetical protein
MTHPIKMMVAYLRHQVKFVLLYCLLVSPAFVITGIMRVSDEVALILAYGVAGAALPFVAVPMSRWLTKMTFYQMRWLNRKNPKEYDDVEDPREMKGFLVHLREQNAAVAIVRAAYIVGTTIIFFKALVPWSRFVQDAVLFDASDLPLRPWDLAGLVARFGLWCLFCALFCVVNVLVTVWLFNYVTRYRNDFVEIQHRKNVAVALIYGALVLATFFVCADVASKTLDVVL